jgi:SAM-dependent methyltransferase
MGPLRQIMGVHTKYRGVAQEVKLMFNEAYALEYRQSDELEAASENHSGICTTLASISRSCGPEIAVLDLGCGTGRYFHCLRNVKWLVGVDVSLPILLQSRCPVKSEEIQIERIDLVCANIFDLELAPNRFDFIYSIGVFGEHSPFDPFVCNKMFSLLKPGGKALFSVVDLESKFPSMSWKRRIAETVWPFLPVPIRLPVRKRLKTYYMTRSQLESVMRGSGFAQYEINLRVSTAVQWIGAQYECLATKAEADPVVPKSQ